MQNEEVLGKNEKHLGIQGSGSLETGELKAAPPDMTTLRPWVAHDRTLQAHGFLITDSTGRDGVCRVIQDPKFDAKPEAERACANAGLIVRAVNAHDLFMSAAKAALKYVDDLNENTPVDPKCKECIQATVYYPKGTPLCWIHQLEAALALAEKPDTSDVSGSNDHK